MRLRVLAAATLFAASTLAGCADDAREPPPADVHLVVGTLLGFGSLDPADAEGAAARLVLPNVFEGLTTLSPATGAPSPSLATSWDVDESRRNYTFHLRGGVAFHDGAQLDAEAAKSSLDRARGEIAGRPGAAAAPLALIRDVRVESPLRLVVEIDRPDPSFPSILALPVASVVSPSAYSPREYRSGARDDPPVGSGPFRVVDVSPDSVRLEAVDAHWSGAARATSVTVRVHENAGALAEAVTSGDVHLAFGGLGWGDVGRPAREEGVVVESVPVPTTRVLFLDSTSESYSDPHVRRAFAYALDRAAVVDDALEGNATPRWGLVPTGIPGGGTEEFRDRYGDGPDRTRALSELALAGYRADNPLRVVIAFSAGIGPDEDAAARVLARSLEATGAIHVSLQSYDEGTLARGAGDGLFPLLLYRASAAVPDAHAYHRAYYASEGARALGGYYDSEEMDALVETEARLEASAREPAWSEMRTLAVEDVPLIPLWGDVEPLVRAANVTGARALATGALLLDDLTRA